MHGCHQKREGGARQIGPHLLDRCPNYYLRRPDALRDEVIKVYQDYKAGVLRRWPDAFAGAIAEGVRLVDREVNACESDLLKAQAAEHRSQQQRSRSAGGR